MWEDIGRKVRKVREGTWRDLGNDRWKELERNLRGHLKKLVNVSGRREGTGGMILD